MGRRGFGKVAMRNELYRRDAERIRTMHDMEGWESAARCLSMLVLSGRYKMAKGMASSVMTLPPMFANGLEAVVAAYGEKAKKAYSKAMEKKEGGNGGDGK